MPHLLRIYIQGAAAGLKHVESWWKFSVLMLFLSVLFLEYMCHISCLKFNSETYVFIDPCSSHLIVTYLKGTVHAKIKNTCLSSYL